MASVVEICNRALSNIGNSRSINSLTEASKEAGECSLHFEACRDAVLSDFDWNFATKRVALADTSNPPPDWEYAYQYPSDCTLHALHYHQTNVQSVQANIAQSEFNAEFEPLLDDLLTIPVAENANWSVEEIQQELDNNVQGILGYVVRWVEQGIGCSKVPDIHNVNSAACRT